MSIEIKLPDIGSDEVEVTELLVNVGDHVNVEQSILTVEGDKASMEIPSPQAGTVKAIKVKIGDKVMTDSLVMIFEGAATSASAEPAVIEKVTPLAATTSSSRKDVKVPDIGADEVDVTEILVKVGDKVTTEQPLLTVEGDKASMEVPAPFDGIVSIINVSVGNKVSTGSLIMQFDVTSSTGEVAAPQHAPQPAANMQPVTTQVISVPDIGGDEVDVTEIMVAVGDVVAIEQPLITVEGDKASMEVPAPASGKVVSIDIKVGDKVNTGSPIMMFEIAGSVAAAPMVTASVTAPQVAASRAQSQPTAASTFVDNTAYVHATPLIRRLAREFGLDLAKTKGSGRKNRILREDVQAYVKNAVKGFESGSVASNSGSLGLLPWPKVDFGKFGEIEERELTKIQKLSGANLHRNWVMIPHVTHFDETDITDIEAFRKQQNAEAEKKKLDVKITPLVFLMKAVANALAAYPRFNSSLTEDGQKLILKKYINIGVAVDTPNGLVVPVFKDVDKKGIIALSRELTEISQKARLGKLTTADMQGGCFTISSLGGIGTTAFTPIINAPEVAILGASRSSTKPIWNGKEFTPRLMLPLSLSFDHRVIDGAEAARFITHLGSVMSDIRRLVM